MHHAYLLLGSKEAGEAFLESALATLGVRREGNPDVYHFSREVFDIADARMLIDKSIEKAFGERKVFIISSARFTLQAQNALLKTFEEPISNTHFFIMAREPLLLPTLVSRVQVVRVEGEAQIVPEAQKFLGLALAKRLDFAKKFEDSLPDFLDSLLLQLKNGGASLETLKKVFTLRLFASDPAAQSRLILEHLALVL
ncbi:hypothetical protein KW785_01700 [Candidatus Parcubacteria bacterium]|nr:hypothetical protein [Candidatus Parcubacteria bacterium]